MLTVTIQPERLMEYMSQVFAGLYDLRAAGEIRLKVRGSGFPLIPPGSVHGAVIPLHLQDETTDTRANIVIDLIDGGNVASWNHLLWSDVYFKAGFRLPMPEKEGAEKIVPFGLRYACTSTQEAIVDRLKFAFLAERQGGWLPSSPGLWLRRLISHPSYLMLSRFKATQSLSRIPLSVNIFEHPPNLEAQPKIYYRTRLYIPDEASSPENAEEFHHVNTMRIGTIRALREHFGPRFIGGIRPTPYALQCCPDVTMNESWNLRRHIQTVQSSLVCVTTTGLFDSIDWKLAEYLAASRCVVTERLKYQLPVPLQEGRHILSFADPGACVEHCTRVLDEPELAVQMRSEGFRYYQEHVKPISIMRNCLKTTSEQVSASKS